MLEELPYHRLALGQPNPDAFMAMLKRVGTYEGNPCELTINLSAILRPQRPACFARVHFLVGPIASLTIAHLALAVSPACGFGPGGAVDSNTHTADRCRRLTHRRRDRGANRIRCLAQRVSIQVGIPCRGLRLGMAKQFSDNRLTHAAASTEGRKVVAQIV